MTARTTLSDTNTKQRGIADTIFMIDWKTAPLLNWFGFGQENMSKLRPLSGWPGTKLEWIEDTMRPYTSTLDGAHNNSTTTIDVASGHGVYFRQGDLIGITSSAGVMEKLLVISVATDALTVAARGYGSTSAGTYSGGETVTILTRAMPELAAHTTGYTTVTTQPFNYTQIISEAVEASRTAIKARNYGYDDELTYQVSKLFVNGGQAGRLPQLLERTWFYGEKVQRGAGNAYGSMGSFRSFLPSERIYDHGDKALSRDAIHKAIREIRDDGGYVDCLLCGGWHMEKIHDMYEDKRQYTQDSEVGGSKVMEITTPHVDGLKVIYHHDMPAGEVHLVCRPKVGWLPFDEFQMGEVENLADGKKVNVVGEYTLFVVNGESHAIIENVSMSK